MAKAKKKDEFGTPDVPAMRDFEMVHRLGNSLYSKEDVRDRVYILEDHIRDLTATVQLQQDQIERLIVLVMTQVSITTTLAGK